MKIWLVIATLAGLGFLAYTGMSYTARLSDNAVQIEQAQAVIQAARAAQDASQAAKIASAGLGATAFVNSLILLLLAITLLVLAAGGLYYLIVIRRQQIQPRPQQWAPGPNARWGKVGAPRQTSLPAPTPQDLVNLMLYQQLIKQGGALPAPAPNGDEPEEDLQW
jgi:hypothetical protein